MKVIFNPRVKSDYFDINQDHYLGLEIGEAYDIKTSITNVSSLNILNSIEVTKDGKLVGVFPKDWFEEA